MTVRIGAAIAAAASLFSLAVASAQTGDTPPDPGYRDAAPKAGYRDAKPQGPTAPGISGTNAAATPTQQRAAIDRLLTPQNNLPDLQSSATFTPTSLLPYNDIDKLKFRQGSGYCLYENDGEKTAFYSKVFAGSPAETTDPVVIKSALIKMGKSFEIYIKRVYPQADGVPVCDFEPFSPDYVETDEEKANQFNRILQNFKITMTDWQPETAVAP